MALHARIEDAVARFADHTAIEDAGSRRLTYRELGALSDRVRDRLRDIGVRTGDRVGVHLPKSIDAVVAILGILKAGAAYVPVDADAPLSRAAYILNDCGVAAVFSTGPHAEPLRAALATQQAGRRLFTLDEAGDLLPIRAFLDSEHGEQPARPTVSAATTPDSLAYILYTSGSTGRPKGVMLSHRCAESFIDWCVQVFAPTTSDRFSSHAPFHFDLSILDLYVPLSSGATLVLIGETSGREPRALAPYVAEKRITVWYSVPSILGMLAQHGRLERYDFGALRLVLFAGEVFPIPQLRLLQRYWPAARYYNLYGPTETNVCTYHEVPMPVPAERNTPLPIGRACEHLRCRVIDAEGRDVAPGVEGELVVSGPAVMLGYWNLAEQDAAAFLADAHGVRWYRTGDLVMEDVREGYVFRGRRDRMVKRRGYRIELGEIEAALALHQAVNEVAVVALGDPDGGVRIKAVLATKGGGRLPLVQLKQFSADHLPRYMVPDLFEFVDALPRTSTDKIDYRVLGGGG